MLEERLSKEIQRINLVRSNRNAKYIFEVIDEGGILNSLNDKLELPLIGVSLDVIAKKDNVYHILYQNPSYINPYIKRIK